MEYDSKVNELLTKLYKIIGRKERPPKIVFSCKEEKEILLELLIEEGIPHRLIINHAAEMISETNEALEYDWCQLISATEKLVVFNCDSSVRLCSTSAQNHDSPPGGVGVSQAEEFNASCACSNSASTKSSQRWRYGLSESGLRCPTISRIAGSGMPAWRS